MLSTIHHMPAIDAVRAASPGAQDSFAVCDMAGFAKMAEAVPTPERNNSVGWLGGKNYAESLACVRAGDLEGVGKSERYLAEMESQVFISRQFRVFDSVVGAVPNIPAFIAGQPLNMRTRRRQPTSTAPLSVFVDLTSSGGIGAEYLYRRGAAILALARLLSNVRAVELWAFVGLGSPGRANYVAVRLDTAPLDLARAAHMLTHASVARGLGYSIAKHDLNSGGSWPYGNVNLQRKHGAAILSRVVHPGAEVLFVPPVYLADDFANPVKWIREMLARYGGETIESD